MATTFSLAGKGLKLDIEDDIKSHVELLSSSTTLTHIDLSGNTFGVGACAALAPLLSKQKNLISIDLHDIFTSRLLEEIPPALSSLLTALLECPKLHTVDLSDNAFGLKTKDPLIDFLSKHVPLRNLILNNNGMGPIAGASIADALSTLASKKTSSNPPLESIVCGRNRLENGSMSSWAKAYQAHNKIKSVKMTQNGIRQEGISHLLREGLSHCKSLEVLDMQDNTFTIKGATALSEILPQWPLLAELGVGDDLLGGNGSVKVFDTLAKGKNAKVEVLRLQYNDITSRGVQALLFAAKEGLPELRRVELNGNKFEEEDASVVALGELLEERKEANGRGDEPEDYWGLDELDELEGEESDQEDEDEEVKEAKTAAEDEEDAAVTILDDADKAEAEPVSQKKDADVDALAEKLDKTHV